MPDRPRPAAAPPPDPAEPTTTLANRVAADIARAVIDGRLAPGSGLREIPLAEQFGVGRSSIREALRILERDGVVRIEPRRGATVTRLSTDELIEIYQVRMALLGLAMALCCERCTDADVAWLAKRHAAMKAAGRGRDGAAPGSGHARISAEMAVYVMRRAGNLRLERLLTQMSLQIARYTQLGLSSSERRAQSVETWGRVIDAMRNRDTGAAERLGRKLVSDTLRFALARIADVAPSSLD